MITIAVYRHDSSKLHKLITRFSRVEATKALMNIGAIEIVLDREQTADLPLQPDTRLVLLLNSEGYSHVFGTYLLGGWENRFRERKHELVLRGLCVNSLLARRIVAYAAGSAQSSKTGPADDVMRAVVRENFGASAGAGRDITPYGFLVEADLSLASNVSMAFAWRNVYDVINDLVKAARQQNGERLLWNVNPVDDGWSMQFVVRKDCFRDRRASSPFALWLSADNNTLENIIEQYDRRDSYNFVYGGGQGEGASREIVTVSDSDDITRSVIARSEHFFDGASYSTTAMLTTASRRRLREGAPKTTVRAKLVEGVNLRYGHDITVGDAVTVKWQAEYDMILSAARLVAVENLVEIDVHLEQL